MADPTLHSRVLPAMLILVLLAIGCANPQPIAKWSENYKSNSKVTFSPTTEANVRVVTKEQADEFAARTKAYFDDRKLAPEDATASDAREVRRMMLDVFRIREQPDDISVIGSSSLGRWQPPRPDEPDLIETAKRNGADTVVMFTFHGGQVTVNEIVQVPTYSTGTAHVWNSRGSHAYATGSSNGSTGQVVQNQRDVWWGHAWFIRHVTPAERAAVDANYSKPRMAPPHN